MAVINQFALYDIVYRAEWDESGRRITLTLRYQGYDSLGVYFLASRWATDIPQENPYQNNVSGISLPNIQGLSSVPVRSTIRVPRTETFVLPLRVSTSDVTLKFYRIGDFGELTEIDEPEPLVPQPEKRTEFGFKVVYEDKGEPTGS